MLYYIMYGMCSTYGMHVAHATHTRMYSIVCVCTHYHYMVTHTCIHSTWYVPICPSCIYHIHTWYMWYTYTTCYVIVL